jgi:quercetin dioxygenase-like cupin family protein
MARGGARRAGLKFHWRPAIAAPPGKGARPMFVYGNNQRAEDLGGGVTRKVLAHDGGLMQVEVAFEEGAVGPLHSHPHEQLTYVLSGEFEFTIGDETKVVRAGDTMYKRSGVMHGCRCLKRGVLLDTFTPQRADYLPK